MVLVNRCGMLMSVKKGKRAGMVCVASIQIRTPTSTPYPIEKCHMSTKVVIHIPSSGKRFISSS